MSPATLKIQVTTPRLFTKMCEKEQIGIKPGQKFVVNMLPKTCILVADMNTGIPAPLGIDTGVLKYKGPYDSPNFPDIKHLFETEEGLPTTLGLTEDQIYLLKPLND